MHLVKRQETVPSEARQIGGVAGWVMEWAHALWLGARMRHEGKKQMYVVETLAIGGRKQLVLVSCGGEHFLVGAGADSVETIVRVHASCAHDEAVPARGFGERP